MKVAGEPVVDDDALVLLGHDQRST
jgi:hypothetical protein